MVTVEAGHAGLFFKDGRHEATLAPGAHAFWKGVAIWRQRDKLDYERLERAATQRDERQALGFYLELTGQLGGDRRLVRRARDLRDGRRTALRPFFSAGRRSFARAAAQEKSPALARRWGFLMNMELESFATAFRKHVRAAA